MHKHFDTTQKKKNKSAAAAAVVAAAATHWKRDRERETDEKTLNEMNERVTIKKN